MCLLGAIIGHKEMHMGQVMELWLLSIDSKTRYQDSLTYMHNIRQNSIQESSYKIINMLTNAMEIFRQHFIRINTHNQYIYFTFLQNLMKLSHNDIKLFICFSNICDNHKFQWASSSLLDEYIQNI